MLISKFGDLDLANKISEPGDFHPFPKYEERESWDSIDQKTKNVWISWAEKFADYQWPALTMEKAIVLKRHGDSFTWWNAFAKRRSILGALWLAECIEGKGRFLDQIMNGVIAFCEETSWMQLHVTGDAGYDLPCPEDCYVDLASSETAALLSWIYYTMKDALDRISLKICERIYKEIYKRIIKPYVEYDQYWWMGFVKTRINNWNPWCNMNVITSYLLIDFGREERAKGLYRAMQSLDRYIETYSPDGCCDEGPNYWGAAGSSFFVCLELLYQASGGVIDIFDEQIVKDMGSYIYKVHIADDYYVNYADGDVIIHNTADVFDYGKRVNDPMLMALGASIKEMELLKEGEWTWFAGYKFLTDLFSKEKRKALGAKPPYPKDAWFYNTQVFTAREKEGSTDGLFLSAKGGNNLESHNHNDIGSFMVFIDGKPVLIDLGTEEYCAQTFSEDRFKLWYLQSQYHNCPTVNGVLQEDGADFKATDVTYTCLEETSSVKMDVKEAYPEQSGIQKWGRETALFRGENAYVEIVDDYVIDKPTDDIRYNFISACKPYEKGAAVCFPYDNGKTAVMEYDNKNLSVEIESIILKDKRLRSNWETDMVYRVVLKEKEPVSGAKRKFKIYKA